MSLVGLGKRDSLFSQTAAGALGPGSYDAKLPQDMNKIKKRSRSDRPLAFGSGAVKELNALPASKFSPGPGFYN